MIRAVVLWGVRPRALQGVYGRTLTSEIPKKSKHGSLLTRSSGLGLDH